MDALEKSEKSVSEKVQSAIKEQGVIINHHRYCVSYCIPLH